MSCLWDLTAEWLREVCHDVTVEYSPAHHLLLNNARTVIHARNFLQCVLSFPPQCTKLSSNRIICRQSLREYGDHPYTVECESFTLLALSTSDGLSKEATVFYDCLPRLSC